MAWAELWAGGTAWAVRGPGGVARAVRVASGVAWAELWAGGTAWAVRGVGGEGGARSVGGVGWRSEGCTRDADRGTSDPCAALPAVVAWERARQRGRR